MNEAPAQAQSIQSNQMKPLDIPPVDQLTKTKTIYEVSGFEVFWRNFIAGMGRAMGSLFVYLILFALIASIVNRFLMPHVLPLLTTLQDSVSTLNELTPKGSNPLQNAISPANLQELLQKNR